MEKLPCEKSGCIYRKSDKNEFCVKHQKLMFVKETERLNKKVCRNYIRGCSTQLDLDYTFSSCQVCLSKERENDKAKHELAKQKLAEINDVSEAKIKICTVCCKEYP